MAVKSTHEKKHGLKISRRKGYNVKCQLIKKLCKYGFKSVRVPALALSMKRLPDVFATKGDTILAFEVKRFLELQLT